MKVLILCLLLFAPAFAQELKDGRKITEWKHLGYSDDIKADLYIAPGTVRRNEAQIKLWARWDFPEGAEKRLHPPNWNGPTMGSFRAFIVLKCEDHLVRGLAVIAYDMQSRVIGEERGDLKIDEKPGTIGHALFNYFCEREPLPPKTPPKLKP